MTLHVVVIGAGIVGVATALRLIDDGHRVTLLDPAEPGGTQAASFGNGAWISPSSVVPMSMPGLWKKVPGFLLDPLGPFTIRWTHLPRLVPWLVRFVLAGRTVERVEKTAAALAPLLARAPAAHAALAAAAGVADLIERRGLLYVYPDRAAFETEALAWRLRADNGVTWTEWSEADLRAREPAVGLHYRFGVHVAAGAHCVDPGTYVATLARHATARGVTVVKGAVTGFEFGGGARLLAVETTAGAVVADRAVIAAGIRSKALARLAGDRVPLEAERGYHVVVPGAMLGLQMGPHIPMMPSDGKMANTMTRAGLRAAGQVELASVDAAPDWRRAAILLQHLKRTFPGLPQDLATGRLPHWVGSRPSTPDGLPVIDVATRSRDIVHAFGHGHVGLAAAPATADLVADLIAGRTDASAPAAFSARRF